MSEKEMIKRKTAAKSVAVTGITAAVYMVATLAIAPLSYGVIQLRFSEVLVLLAFLNKKYAPGLILGCALANLFSPLGLLDVVFGTLATTCTMIAITRTKSLLLATLWPTVFCLFIGLEYYLAEGLPFLFTTVTVMLGEFAVVTCVGYPLMRLLLKQEVIIKFLKS